MKAAALAALLAGAGANVYDRIWASGMASMAKWTDTTRPQKHSRTSSHKQNARKAKRKGGTP